MPPGQHVGRVTDCLTVDHSPIGQVNGDHSGVGRASATFGIAGAILLESGLSFLNFGADLSWGALLASGKTYMSQAWGITVFPGLAIFLAVTSFNLVGEGLRDALDPRLKT